jgi:hypothetical protein
VAPDGDCRVNMTHPATFHIYQGLVGDLEVILENLTNNWQTALNLSPITDFFDLTKNVRASFAIGQFALSGNSTKTIPAESVTRSLTPQGIGDTLQAQKPLDLLKDSHVLP